MKKARVFKHFSSSTSPPNRLRPRPPAKLVNCLQSRSRCVATNGNTIFCFAFLSIFLFGIEELAVQLEEPFSILPLDRLCSGLLETADDALVWGAGSAHGLAGRKGGEKR